VLGLLLRWRWRGGAWRKIRLFDDKKQDAAPVAAELPALSEATQGVPSTPTTVRAE